MSKKSVGVVIGAAAAAISLIVVVIFAFGRPSEADQAEPQTTAYLPSPSSSPAISSSSTPPDCALGDKDYSDLPPACQTLAPPAPPATRDQTKTASFVEAFITQWEQYDSSESASDRQGRLAKFTDETFSPSKSARTDSSLLNLNAVTHMDDSPGAMLLVTFDKVNPDGSWRYTAQGNVIGTYTQISQQSNWYLPAAWAVTVTPESPHKVLSVKVNIPSLDAAP